MLKILSLYKKFDFEYNKLFKEIINSKNCEICVL